MNLAPQRQEAEPALAGIKRKVGEIWREGSRFYEQLLGGAWELPHVTTYIEHDDRSELLRFGVRLIDGRLCRCSLLTVPLGLDDVEWSEAARSFTC